MKIPHLDRAFHLLLLCTLVGCSTTKSTDTPRTGSEQLLISSSIDHALDKVNFSPLSDSRVFIDDKYVDCVDKNYLVASVRHRVMAQGAILAPAADKADIVLELRNGAVGTDRVESFFGIPEINLPAPMPVALPEVRVITKESQFGTAKIGIVAYDAKTNEVLGTGGLTSARSDDNNWFIFGVGPWKDGSVKQEMNIALQPSMRNNSLPRNVALRAPLPQEADIPGKPKATPFNTVSAGSEQLMQKKEK